MTELCPFKNSYVEVPSPSVMVFGGGVFGSKLDLEGVMRVESP